ncbi:MAG: TlpA family protein disulfide reductase [Betaproteobacteria bacterium]|nr:TlpA family protein disulfide reductase [Betaproteobacteria bacterium]
MPWNGGPTPALALEDLHGRPVRLEGFKGKVVLVNFWATWCEPCRDEMPSIQRLRQELDGKAFEVVAVNVAEPRSRVEAFLERTKLDLPVLLDHSGDAARGWRARILPATFIVGPDGSIRYSHAGELAWDEPRIVELISALLRAR